MTNKFKVFFVYKRYIFTYVPCIKWRKIHFAVLYKLFIIFNGISSSDTFQMVKMNIFYSSAMSFERKHMLSHHQFNCPQKKLTSSQLVYTLASQVFLLSISFIKSRIQHYITCFARLGIYVLNSEFTSNSYVCHQFMMSEDTT